MKYDPRKLLVILTLAAAILIGLGPQAFAQESIEQLLEQVDQTLQNKRPAGEKSDAPKGQRRAPKSEPKNDEKVAEPKPPEPLSTPNLFNMPEETASIQRLDAPRLGRVIAGVTTRRLASVGRLEKDDDQFVIAGQQRLGGVGLSVDHQVSEIPIKNYTVGIFAGGGVSVYRGNLAIKRRGVYNQDMHADVTLVPWNAAIGARFPAYRMVFLETSFQAIVEAINQSGQGVTDTVSDVLPSDAVTVGVGMKVGERFAGLLSWQRRGVLLSGEQSSIPGDSFSLALGSYL